ncbi:MAG: hypothetical protein WDN27_04275 [Candidatus Saccharibacteria bacterium]
MIDPPDEVKLTVGEAVTYSIVIVTVSSVPLVQVRLPVALVELPVLNKVASCTQLSPTIHSLYYWTPSPAHGRRD